MSLPAVDIYHHTAVINMSVYRKLDRVDPTKTLHLQRAFIRELNKRFRALRGAIRRMIVDEDCFGLTKASREFKVTVMAARFTFPRKADKVDAFMGWLRQQEQEGVLKTSTFRQVGEPIEGAWTDKFITDSYQRGIQRSRYEMTYAGMKVPPLLEAGGIAAVMALPVHVDRVGVIATRAFNDLKGITDAMDNQISRVLSQGMIDGDNPMLLAKKLTRTISGPVGDLGLTDTLGRFIPAERRAQMLARTEIVRAHHLGNVQEMRNWGVEGVKVKAEWATAGDSRVCSECAMMEGKVFTLDEIEGMIPAHPSCRCCAIPSKVGKKGSR